MPLKNKQLPYNLGFVCFPVIPGGDGQEATLQDHSSRTNTGVIYKGPSDAGLQLWENARTRQMERAWGGGGPKLENNSAEVPGSSCLGSYLFLFLSKLTAFWKFSISAAIMMHFYHIIMPMKFTEAFFLISQLSRKSTVVAQKLYLLGLLEVNVLLIFITEN